VQSLLLQRPDRQIFVDRRPGGYLAGLALDMFDRRIDRHEFAHDPGIIFGLSLVPDDIPKF
jgi:hypothetical protein